MKVLSSLVLISASLIGGTAFAAQRAPSGELDYPPAVSTASSVTRAQVQAELQDAKTQGLVTFGELDQPAVVASHSNVSRAAVRAQAVQARASASYDSSELGSPSVQG